MKAATKIIVATAVVCLFYTAQARAQEVPTGKTYTCYLYSPVEFVDTGITFGENGVLSLSRFNGTGLYVSIGTLFSGSVLAFNTTYAGEYGDLAFTLLGSTAGPFIIGTGTVSINFEEPYILLLVGFEATPPPSNKS